MSFVFDAFLAIFDHFLCHFLPTRRVVVQIFIKKASFLWFFTQKSSFFDDFFINCCKIGNVHKNNIEKHPKKSSILLCFNPFLLCFNPFLRLFFDEKQCKIGKYGLIFIVKNHTKFWSKMAKIVKIAKSGQKRPKWQKVAKSQKR